MYTVKLLYPTPLHITKRKNKINDFQWTKNNNFLSNVCWQDSEKTWLKLLESDISAYWNQHFNYLKRRSFLWKQKTTFFARMEHSQNVTMYLKLNRGMQLEFKQTWSNQPCKILFLSHANVHKPMTRTNLYWSMYKRKIKVHFKTTRHQTNNG